MDLCFDPVPVAEVTQLKLDYTGKRAECLAAGWSYGAITNGGCGNPQFTTCLLNPHIGVQCTDIDECNDPDNPEANGGCGDPEFVTCVNAYNRPQVCVDVNECETNNGGCGDPTYFTCTNLDGEAPSSANGGCVDIDECVVRRNGGCGDPQFETCTNNVGAEPTCTSKVGVDAIEYFESIPLRTTGVQLTWAWDMLTPETRDNPARSFTVYRNNGGSRGAIDIEVAVVPWDDAAAGVYTATATRLTGGTAYQFKLLVTMAPGHDPQYLGDDDANPITTTQTTAPDRRSLRRS